MAIEGLMNFVGTSLLITNLFVPPGYALTFPRMVSFPVAQPVILRSHTGKITTLLPIFDVSTFIQDLEFVEAKQIPMCPRSLEGALVEVMTLH